MEATMNVIRQIREKGPQISDFFFKLVAILLAFLVGGILIALLKDGERKQWIEQYEKERQRNATTQTAPAIERFIEDRYFVRGDDLIRGLADLDKWILYNENRIITVKWAPVPKVVNGNTEGYYVWVEAVDKARLLPTSQPGR
ncbi:hypothetical protein KW782_04345 [Candidatus Parcubacteria bacterium]|nr:hypothetical protein [Candidatus Parcubacteria bacterium]